MSVKLKKEIVSAQMQITNDVTSAWKSQILFTLNHLKIFSALEGEPKNVLDLSKRLQIPEDSLRRLLNAAVAVGYLQKAAEQYSISPLYKTVTKEGAEGFLGNWIEMYSRWFITFTKLTEAVKEGKAVEDINLVTDEGYHRAFIEGMKDYASYRGQDILNHIDLSKVSNLLDVGCGPGIYTAMFCEKYPQIRCTCYDVPQALDLAREHVTRLGVQERVTFQAGNYKEDESFGELLYDVVFISHVLHQEDEVMCSNIVKKAFNALKPGGTIIIQAMFLSDSGIGPVYASLHDLLCLLIFPGGRNYTFKEVMTLLEKAGFTNVQDKKMSIFNVNSLVLGKKGEA